VGRRADHQEVDVQRGACGGIAHLANVDGDVFQPQPVRDGLGKFLCVAEHRFVHDEGAQWAAHEDLRLLM
jgi:hypothetical protein